MPASVKKTEKASSSKVAPTAKSSAIPEKITQFIPLFFPFVLWIGKIRLHTLKIDFYAAITSAIFALPQGIAFALIAGLPPEFGLYAAIVAPVVSALFGSSWHAVAGPTVATSIVIIGILSEYAVPQSPHFIGYALILTLLAGLIQLGLGVFRLGHIVNFISHTVILGFSTGAAILIMGSQLSGILGIQFPRQDNIALTLYQTYLQLSESNLYIFFISLSTCIVALLCNKYYKQLPYLLIAMIYGSVVAVFMTLVMKIDSIGMIGALPKGLPSITIPNLSWFQTRELFASAIAIATLGLIQSVSIAKTIAIKTEQPIDANQEFIGQGLSNIVCSFTNGFFSSNSFTRTGVNYAAGAKTPLSSIMASGLILALLLFASGITTYLPMASMSAIIMIIGWKLIDIPHIKKIFTTSRTESAIFWVTLLSTLFLSLEFAIYSGMFLSLIIYLQKTSQPKVIRLTEDKFDPYHRLIPLPKDKEKDSSPLMIVRIDGSAFFGSVEHIRKSVDLSQLSPGGHLLLICESINLIDIAGTEFLLFLKKMVNKQGGNLYLAGLTPAVRRYLIGSPYWKQLGGKTNIFNYQAEAISHINHLIEEKEQQELKKSLKKSSPNDLL